MQSAKRSRHVFGAAHVNRGPRNQRRQCTVDTNVYVYHPEVVEALAVHGLAPRGDTPPQQLRDALRELYKYEIRRLRGRLIAGEILKIDYAGHVVSLRKRYWLLSVPTELWTAGADLRR
jgi:hypothetical protein